MDIEMLREYCLNLEGTTEEIKWEENLCFMIEQKIFLVYSLSKGGIAIKCDPEEFDELTARDGIQQAFHFAKRHWIGIAELDVLPAAELKQRIEDSRALVLNKLPKKLQEKYR